MATRPRKRSTVVRTVQTVIERKLRDARGSAIARLKKKGRIYDSRVPSSGGLASKKGKKIRKKGKMSATPAYKGLPRGS